MEVVFFAGVRFFSTMAVADGFQTEMILLVMSHSGKQTSFVDKEEIF